MLVVKPRKPQFDLNQVSVQYLLVASPTSPAAASAGVPGAAYLSLNITLLFTAGNPNKVGIRYGATAFDVMYHGVPLGVAAAPGFEQPPDLVFFCSFAYKIFLDVLFFVSSI